MSGTKRFDAIGPTSDDGTFLHYRTTDGFVVSSDRDTRGEEYVKSDRTMVIIP